MIKKTYSTIISLLICSAFVCTNAQSSGNEELPARQMEYLGRGLVAVKISDGVFLSWRSLATDAPDTSFKLYKNGKLLKTISASSPTNYTDISGLASTKYKVETYVGSQLKDVSEEVATWANQWKIVQMQRPEGGTTPAGEAYTYTPGDCSAGDLDGDGEYEIVVKWDPSNAKDNANSGYSGNVILDAYKLDGTFLWRIDLGINIRSGAHYTQFMVYDLNGDGRAEVACKTAPGSKDGLGEYVKSTYNNTDYRNSSGYILTGNEYLTLFDGLTGKNLSTVNFSPARGSVSDWGDNYGNRSDRFLACIAYLDGVHPSLVMGRGYYAKTALTAYDYKNGALVERWKYDSGKTSSSSNAYSQGNHNLSAGDVDGDGKDEIIYGASAFDDDGKMMYRTGLGHGDAMHFSDLDPDRTGLEVFEVHEETGSGRWNHELHDARTGEIIWHSTAYNSDNGRGMSGDIDANHRGFEMWSSSEAGVYDCKGNQISTSKPTVNFRIYWDGDLQDELLDGTKLDKWNVGRLMTFYNFSNAHDINGTKATPCLSGDILGDWREEVVYYNGSDPSQLVIFTTITPTEHKLYTLMHDPVYRLGIAWQNVAYNQPPHLGFYIGDGLDNIPRPNIYTSKYENNPITSIEKTTKSNPLQAYCSSDGVHLVSPDAIIRSVSIYSIKGKLLYRNNKINTTELVCPVKWYGKGILLIKALTENGTTVLISRCWQT
jgi:rhamnogalacturonan endolyase